MQTLQANFYMACSDCRPLFVRGSQSWQAYILQVRSNQGRIEPQCALGQMHDCAIGSEQAIGQFYSLVTWLLWYHVRTSWQWL